MSAEEVAAVQRIDIVTMVESPEVEEDARTVSSEGSMPQSQCTPDEADSEDEFKDAMEPPSSTSGVLMAFDGAAPPLSGVYEDALEATEQQVAAALESTNSDGSGRQSTIQEEDEEEEEDVETETAEIEAEVVAAVEEIVELATRGGVNISEACSDEVVELTEEHANAQAEEDLVGQQEDQNDTVEDAEGDAIVEQNAEELESSQETLEQEGAVDGPAPDERNTSDETTFEEAGCPSDDNEEANAPDAPVVSKATEAEQPSTPGVVEDVSGVISSVDAEEFVEQDAMDCVDKIENTDSEPPGDVECTSKKEVKVVVDVVAAGEASDGLVDEAQDTTVANAKVALETPEVHQTSEEVSIETAKQHSSSRIDAVLESEESAKEKAPDEEQVAEPAPEEKNNDEPADGAVDELEKVVAIEDGSQDEPVAEEVGNDKPITSADEQTTPPKATANPDESVTEAADGDSVDGTEQEPSQPEEIVDTVHEADAKEIIPQAANDPVEAVQAEVEENQQADLNSSDAASSDSDKKPEQCDTEPSLPEDSDTVITEAAAPEPNPAEEEPEAPPAFQGAPSSSSRKSSDHEHEHEHERNLAAVSLLPRLAPSSETTTTTTATTIEPFILSSEGTEMLEGHFPPQRFTYEVFGFSIDKRVVYYHVHRSDRRTGVREPAILKRYTDFRELQTQLLDSCLRVAADMPRIPKPHLGTVLRGYKSKRTIEVRERSFRALLRYIAQYPALHGSAIFERFITTSRATSGPGWM